MNEGKADSRMKKKKKTKHSKKPGREALAQAYPESWKAADKIVELTNEGFPAQKARRELCAPVFSFVETESLKEDVSHGVVHD